MGSSLRDHPIVASVTAAYTVGLGGYGIATGSPLAIPYLLEMAVLIWLVVRLDARRPFSPFVLWGLSLWGLMHMAGGMLEFGGDTLYETWLFPFLRWDHVVHAVGFGAGGVAVFEAFLPWMTTPPEAGAGAWVAFMGSAAIGALNETVEFLASRVLPFANVGDEVNTGLDLIANTVGGAVAAWIVYRWAVRRHGAG